MKSRTTMTMQSDPEERQESEYWLPYHYISRFEGGFSASYHDSWGINYVSTIEFLLERVADLRWHSAIDVGCGDGRIAREIARRHPDRHVLGVDASSRAVGLAAAMNPDVSNLCFAVRDIASAVPKAGETFDLALAIEVLEHLPPSDLEGFIAGIARQLKPGGRLLVTVPHSNKPVEPCHYQHFTIDSITRAVSSSFQIEVAMPFEQRGFRRRIVRALIGNQWFILNHAGLLERIYRYYRARLFDCESEAQCQRVFVVARKVIG